MKILPNELILCATARLSHGLQLDYQHQQSHKQLQWQTPQILTLQQWLTQLTQQSLLNGEIKPDNLPFICLGAVAEKILWQEAIKSAIQKHELAALFDVMGLADVAMQANKLLVEWQISDEVFNTYYQSVETRQFIRWRESFRALCITHDAIEPARYMVLQIENILTTALPLPAEINLAGFDRLTPLEQQLIDNLTAKNISVNFLNHNQLASSVLQMGCADINAECRAAVAWAQQALTKNPQANLAIITPVLGVIKSKLANLLDDIFHPETLHPSLYEKPRITDFSLGAPLSDHPLIASALRLIQLACSKQSVPQANISAVLLDVFWGEPSEADARHLLDAQMRKNLSRDICLQNLHSLAQKTIGQQLPLFFEHLNTLQNAQNNWRGLHKPSYWAFQFNQLLTDLNWAKPRELSSYEYQAQQSWLELLQTFAQWDGLTGAIQAHDAFIQLLQLNAGCMFLPETVGSPRVQLLGMLETSAVALDGLWVLGLNDQQWPPPASPNALLPIKLQREKGMPNADTDIQASFAYKVQERLLKSSKNIVFSWSHKEGDRELLPSPSLNQMAFNTEFLQVNTFAEKLSAQLSTVEMQYLDDANAPVISLADKLRGGSALFEAQAVCPAWAFYQHRLGARALQKPTDGLDSLARGNLVHSVLQQFWLSCKTAANLKAMSNAELDSAIKLAVESAIKKLLKHKIISKQILVIERQRLEPLIFSWLQLEKQRDDFFVFACEAQHILMIEGLEITLRIDRIDVLDDGSLIIIDYKTGMSTPDNSSWADTRITKPQLPLYAALVFKDERVVAACFAKVDAIDPRFSGVALNDILPEIKPFDSLKGGSVFKEFANFDALILHWQLSLTAIAHEIKNGAASVKFKNETDLTYCEVKPILRLPERALQFEQHLK